MGPSTLLEDIESITGRAEGEDDNDEERRVPKALIGRRMLRRRRVRRAVLASLLREAA